MLTTFYIKQGRKYVKTNPYSGLNPSVTILGGVRYSLGRASYSPSCVMDFCRENWRALEKNTRHVIMRDVMEWLGDRHEWVKDGENDMAWPDQWREFLLWAMLQDGEEAANAVRANHWRRDRMKGVDQFWGFAPC